MKKEDVQDFTRRISQANRSGLVVVSYDIFFAYLGDARAAFDAKEWDDWKDALRHADRVIAELVDALDFSQPLAANLFGIYTFCRQSLARSMSRRDMSGVDDAERQMRKLGDAFAKVAVQDDSPPLMQNAQQVYAGYTYGKNDLVESGGADVSRGFLV